MRVLKVIFGSLVVVVAAFLVVIFLARKRRFIGAALKLK
jgi:hypothetical protein